MCRRKLRLRRRFCRMRREIDLCLGVSSAFLMLLVGVDIQAQEHCNALFDHGIFEMAQSMASEDWDMFVYHSLCDGSQRLRSMSLDGEINIPVKLLRLGVEGTFISGGIRVDKYCKANEAKFRGTEGKATRVTALNSKALDAWNKCQALAREDVTIDADIGTGSVDFTISRKSPQNVRLESVFFSGMSVCQVNGQRLKSRRKGTTETFTLGVASGEALQIDLLEAHEYTVHCKRAVEPSAEVSKDEFQRAEVRISTSRGSLRIDLPKKNITHARFENEIHGRFSALEARVDAMAQELHQLPNTPESAVPILSHEGEWGMWQAKKTCPTGHYVCGYQSKFEESQGASGDDTALNAIRLFCCPFTHEDQ